MIAEQRAGQEGKHGTITVEGLEALTRKGLTEELIVASNKQLTDTYKHVVVSYGFQDFHSLYLFALSNTQKEIKKYDAGKPKDYTSMSKVRRTIVRDGRRTNVTLYEKPRGLDNKQKIGGRSKRKESKTAEPNSGAAGLSILAQGDLEEPIPTKELHAINKIIEGFVVIGHMRDLDRIKMYLDEDLHPMAVQGLRVDGEFLTSPFLAINGEVQGIDQRAFFELIKVAMNWGLGVKMEIEGTKIQDILAQTSGMKEVDGTYQISHKELLDKFGELP